MARTKIKKTRRQKIKENNEGKPRSISKYALKTEKRRKERNAED